MKIYFDKLYRYDRLQEPAGIALPFKEGELKSADRIAITQNGRKCMVQPKVTSKHADGSIRYLYVDFLADIPANIDLNRKVLSEMAVNDAEGFAKLAEVAKSKLA